MRRRDFIAGVASAAALPVAADAQERPRRVGVLMGTAESDPDQKALVHDFVQALAELGWPERTKVAFEYRWAAGDTTRLQAHAAELGRLGLDAIFAQGTPATSALRRSAPATPLVFVNVTDPIVTGLVSSLAHPGGNITGFTNYEFTMGGKWLGTLREIAPAVTRIAVVFNPDNPVMAGNLRSIEAAAPTLGVEIFARPARNAEEFERIIRAFASEPNSGMLVLLDFLTLANRDLIVGLANRHRLPAGFALRVFATSGGLFSYGVDPVDLFRRAASYVDRILKGAKPADLPVQQPNKFQLVINLKTAAAIGLSVPLTVLARADEVIE